jgi:flavodoxin
MKTAVFYLSRTGNTKRFAEAISESLAAPLFDVTSIKPETQTHYDLLFIGTPVNGFTACPEVFSFIQKLPIGVNKKAILFCTYAIAKGNTLENLKQVLSKKGYTTLLMVSKRGIKPSKNDFAGVLNEIKTCVRQLDAHNS